MLVRVLWAGRYGRGAVDRSDALAAEVLVRALLARVLLCVAQMAQAAMWSTKSRVQGRRCRMA